MDIVIIELFSAILQSFLWIALPMLAIYMVVSVFMGLFRGW